MKKVLLAALVLTSAAVSAHRQFEELNCGVTEPFINYTFEPILGTLTQTDVETAPAVTVLSRNAKLVSVTPSEMDGLLGSKYKVIDTVTGQVYIEMTLNLLGTDGMSDQIYPFDAKIGSWYAGCSSTSAPTIDPITSIYKLQNSEY